MRHGVAAPFDVTMVRDVIHIKPVKYNAENDVGYVHITSFNEQTTADLEKAVADLKKEIGPKLKGYIIDLRNNPGGLLDQAISVSDDFPRPGSDRAYQRSQYRGERSGLTRGWATSADGKKLSC